MKLIIKHERKLSTEIINQALSMHGLIATKDKNWKKKKREMKFKL